MLFTILTMLWDCSWNSILGIILKCGFGNVSRMMFDHVLGMFLEQCSGKVLKLGRCVTLQDLRWDYDSYECVFGVSVVWETEDDGLTGHFIEDGDLKYHTVTHSNLTDWTKFTEMETLQLMGLCGVYPYNVDSAQIAVTRDECNNFQDEVRVKL